MKLFTHATLCAALVLIVCGAVHAQAPAPASASPWSGNIGGGFAFTDGNSDTANFNLTFAVIRNPKTRNVIKWGGLYLRGAQNGAETIDRTSTTLRDEFVVSNRTFTFGQVDYMRDKFKNIIGLWSPTAGVGYKIVNRDAIVMSLDNGLGGVWEKNPGRNTRGSGAYNAAERLNWKISKTATVTQSLIGLWKTNEFADALYNSTLGVAASLTQKLEIKFEINDVYKSRPPLATLRKSDLAVITAFVVKF